jgi:hypothetical protein
MRQLMDRYMTAHTSISFSHNRVWDNKQQLYDAYHIIHKKPTPIKQESAQPRPSLLGGVIKTVTSTIATDKLAS